MSVENTENLRGRGTLISNNGSITAPPDTFKSITSKGDKSLQESSPTKSYLCPHQAVAATVLKTKKKAYRSITVPKTVKYQNIKFKVRGISKNALKGIRKNVVVRMPKSKLKAYTKQFRKRGMPKSVKIAKL